MRKLVTFIAITAVLSLAGRAMANAEWATADDFETSLNLGDLGGAGPYTTSSPYDRVWLDDWSANNTGFGVVADPIEADSCMKVWTDWTYTTNEILTPIADQQGRAMEASIYWLDDPANGDGGKMSLQQYDAALPGGGFIWINFGYYGSHDPYGHGENVRFGVYNGSGGGGSVANVYRPRASVATWRHLRVSIQANQLKAYVDGELIYDQATDAGFTFSDWVGWDSMYLYNYENGEGDFQGAYFDDVYAGDAIPEPATLALLGMGGVAMLIRRRR